MKSLKNICQVFLSERKTKNCIEAENFLSKSLSSREDNHKLVQNLINKLKLRDQFTTENDVTIFDIIISGSDQS